MSLVPTMDTERSLDAEVIDLARIAGPASRLVAIYDGITRGDRPTPGRLDTILGQLGELPRPPGQLGADIALLASGGDGHDREQVVAAIERLRRVSTLGRSTATASPPPSRRGRGRRKQPTGQLELPGIADEGTRP